MTPAPRPRGRPIDYVLNWFPTILFAVVLPYVTYGFLTDRHLTGPVPALLISGVWPALESLGMLLIRRKADELGVLVLIVLGISVVGMVAFNSPDMILIKESVVTGLVGAVFLVSLLLARPLMFYFGRKFATNGTREAVQYWNDLWQYAGFRHTQRVLTVVWGLGFIAESAIRVIVVASGALPIGTTLLVSSIFPYVVLGALMVFTIVYTRLSVRRSSAAGTAADELRRLSSQA